MNPPIASAVGRCSRLSLKINKGERHRIMHRGIESGSLWVTPRARDYLVTVTGGAEDAMYAWLCSQFGVEAGYDQGKRLWYIETMAEVARIVAYFGEV